MAVSATAAPSTVTSPRSGSMAIAPATMRGVASLAGARRSTASTRATSSRGLKGLVR